MAVEESIRLASMRAARAARVLACCLAAATGAAAAPAVERESDDAFVQALDAETDGRFSELRQARDPSRTLAHYDELVDAYVRVADALYDEYDDASLRFPGWWTDQLVHLGLGSLADDDSAQVDFFRAQLASEDFDRVVHAYYVLSLNRRALEKTGVRVPAVRGELVRRARADAKHRFWISLWLAESRLLDDPLKQRTELVTRVETVREYVGRNARELGPRIHRVLDLPRDLVNDTRVSHYYISEARREAEGRIRRHWLLAEGPGAGYLAIQQELTSLQTDRFRRNRFQQILSKDLHYLLEEFGLPADPKGLLRQIRTLYEEKGNFDFDQRVAIDALGASYEARMAAEVGGRVPERVVNAQLSTDEIIQRGPDGAYAFVVDAMNDRSQNAQIESLLGRDVVPKLVATYPPEQPVAVREAVVAGYAAAGHPASLRPNYLAALAALQSVVPGNDPADVAPRRGVAELSVLFAEADDYKEFGRAYRALHRAAEAGAFPEGSEAPEELVRALAESAVALIRTRETNRRQAAQASLRAWNDMASAEQELAGAQRVIRESNATIAASNAALTEAESRLASAVARRNAAVEELNTAVSQANDARSRLYGARQRSAMAPELAELEQQEAVAVRRVGELEQTLDGTIAEAEAEAAQASDDADAALARASLARQRGEAARRTLDAAAERENEGYEAKALADADLASSTSTILAVLNQTARSLAAIGVLRSATPRDGGEDTSAQLAGLVELAELAFAGRELADSSGELERSLASSDSAVRALGQLVVDTQSDPATARR